MRIIKNVINKNFFVLNNLAYLLRFIFISNISTLLLKNNGEIQIFMFDHNKIYDLVFFLKNNFLFCCDQLLDFTIIDRSEMPVKKNKRFEYLYVLLSTKYNVRIFIRGFISMFESLKSLVVLFNSINWLEREVWDMFGVLIVNHPDLRRILTDYGFLGFPLKKDYPLTGYVEMRYDEVTKYIVIEPLELSQEFRFFKFENSWKI